MTDLLATGMTGPSSTDGTGLSLADGTRGARETGPLFASGVARTVERPRRSALYLPASNPRALAKARTLPCDVVILDLEDAVAPEAKDAARAAVVAAVREGGWSPRELVVRVNALASAWGEADAAALAAILAEGARDGASGGVPDAVLLPKVASPVDVAAWAARLPGIPLWAMVESAAAVLRLDALAGAPGLAALVVGTNDLVTELRMRPGADRLPLHPFLAQTVAAARAHGLSVFDGVCNAIDDPAVLAAECAQGRAFGFDGKTLIHPAQIAAANAAFAPDAEEVAGAEAIVAAFAAPEAAAKGAVRCGGRMVERLHLAEARRVLASARLMDARERATRP